MGERPISDHFEQELAAVSEGTIMDPAYRRRKLVLWLIRTAITVALYYFFWKYEWVRWTLILTVPLSLFSLAMIVLSPLILKRKIEKTRRKIVEADRPGVEEGDQ